ncbi:MAG: GNAT family N-acetyltransferase [Treponemataceae bacterium]
MIVERYEDKYETLWDDFVLHKSINGTFLQSRKFLNYHSKDRFEDCSLLVVNKKNNLAAVIPACTQYESNEKKTFFSHKGSTYGGIVVDKKHYTANSLLEIIDAVELYLHEQGFSAIYLKVTPDILSNEKPDLLEYLLYYKNYKQFSELNTYIDLEKYDENIVANFSQGKRTNINNCVKAGLYCEQIDSEVEIKLVYDMLCENLKKYNVAPVHTIEELVALKEKYISNNIKFFACYDVEKNLVSGAVVFCFPNTKTLHTQYLCADERLAKLSPMSFMYYSMILHAKEIGYKKVSWGIATEQQGTVLNEGLLRSKEAYGSTYSVNKSFYKEL